MSCFLHVGIPCVCSLYKNVVPCTGGFRVIFSLLPLGDASQEFVTWTQQAWKWRVVQERCRETCWNTVHAQTRGTTKWMIKCVRRFYIPTADTASRYSLDIVANLEINSRFLSFSHETFYINQALIIFCKCSSCKRIRVKNARSFEYKEQAVA